MVILITGQAGTGKTTAARKIRDLLCKAGKSVVHFDGDVIRKCWTNVKYDKASRKLNVKRICNMSSSLLFHNLADVIIVSVVAPIAESREEFYDDPLLREIGVDELRLTKIHKRRPEHYYSEFEESQRCIPKYQGSMGLATLLTELENKYREELNGKG